MLNAMIEISPPPPYWNFLQSPVELHRQYWRDILKTGCGIAEYLFFHAETDIISPPFEQFVEILIQARCVF